MRSGGQILIEQLRLNGAERLFTVPGESFIAALDALHDATEIDVVVCRHEGAAAMMAEATARLAGPDRPAAGLAIVSRGPGLANAMSGLHVAMQNATAMLVLVGLPPRGFEGRHGFQEVAIEPLTGLFAKHAETVRDLSRLPEAVMRALAVAHAGRPGPVVLGVPEDVLIETSNAANAPPVVLPEPGPTYDDMIRLADAIDAAEWPILLIGGRWDAGSSRRLQDYAERLDLPVMTAFRSQDAIDNRSHCYCGHAGLAPPPKLRSALASADLIVAIGTHLDEITTGGYDTIAVPGPRQKLIHVHPDAAAIGRNHHTPIAIVSSIARFTRHLDDLMPSIRPGMQQHWSRLRADMRAAYTASRNVPPSSGTLRLEDVIKHLDATLPEDAIITNGAGNYAAFLHRIFTYKTPRSQLAPISGSMGYGLPAAIAAKLAHPERTVVALAGDGCFQMVAQDLATAVQFGAAIIVIIANNSGLGTIRAAQERQYPGRVVATSLVNPDFAALAAANHAQGHRVGDLEQFDEALSAALAATGPFVIELSLDRNTLAPGIVIGAEQAGLTKPK